LFSQFLSCPKLRFTSLVPSVLSTWARAGTSYWNLALARAPERDGRGAGGFTV